MPEKRTMRVTELPEPLGAQVSLAWCESMVTDNVPPIYVAEWDSCPEWTFEGAAFRGKWRVILDGKRRVAAAVITRRKWIDALVYAGLTQEECRYVQMVTVCPRRITGKFQW